MNKKEEEESVIEIRLKGSEIIERGVTKFGTGAHVIVPSDYIGKKVKIIFEKEGKDER